MSVAAPPSSTTQILPPSPEGIQQAAAALRRGELVAIPTETVYGLAGNGLNAQALAAIFEAKKRPLFDPLIIHVAPGYLGSSSPQNWARALVERQLIDLMALGEREIKALGPLLSHFWPGPLTVVLPKGPLIPELATGGLPTVAVRMPAHPLALQLIDTAQLPLAAPSANRFGRISPTHPDHVLAELGGQIPYILDGGPCAVGVESTVISLDPPRLLRPGGIPQVDIEALLSFLWNEKVVLERQAPSTLEHKAPAAKDAPAEPAMSAGLDVPLRPVLAPGMLGQHYAPAKPLILLASLLEEAQTLPTPGLSAQGGHNRIGLLLWNHARRSLALARLAQLNPALDLRRILALTPSGSAQEAAQNLFAQLRALDEDPYVDEIWAEPCPISDGLGLAIQDRMQRASQRRSV